MDFIIEEADSYEKIEGYEVEFCGTTWTIVEVYDHPKLDEDDGLCNFNSQTIYINAELHTHRKRLAVVHELLHVLCDSVGIDEDEELIRQMEHRVFELIKIFPEAYK